jgi:hypothetical protein
LHLPVGAKLGHTKGACKKAAAAANTGVLINEHDTILGPFRNRAGRTSGLTGRLPTVQAAKGDGSIHHIRVFSIPEGNDPSPMNPKFDMVKALTRYFTGVTLDTSVCIKIEAILMGHHEYLLS